MVDRRCAMTRVVRPACSLARASCGSHAGLTPSLTSHTAPALVHSSQAKAARLPECAQQCSALRLGMLGPAARAHLHQALAGRVQGAASLVKQQQAGVACEGPCDAHALLLAPAQGNATCIPQLQHRGRSQCTAAFVRPSCMCTPERHSSRGCTDALRAGNEHGARWLRGAMVPAGTSQLHSSARGHAAILGRARAVPSSMRCFPPADSCLIGCHAGLQARTGRWVPVC